MLVYRIEHKDTQEGPYTGLNCCIQMAYAHCDETHPAAWEDSKATKKMYHKYDTDKLRYGMSSLMGILTWFNKWIPELAAKGYILTVYQVPDKDCAVGYQIVFKLKYAKLVFTDQLADIETIRNTNEVDKYIYSYQQRQKENSYTG